MTAVELDQSRTYPRERVALSAVAMRRLVIGLFVGVAVAVGLSTREVYDDPWILYRYAENLASGSGWSFNPGQETENAVTSVLSVLLLAVGLLAHVPVSVSAGLLFVAGSAASASFTYLTLRRAGHAPAGVAAGFFILLCPPLVTLRGMETAVYLGLLAAGLYTVSIRRYLSSGVVLGLAVLARPDAAVVAAAIVVWIVVRTRRIPWRMAVGAAVVLVPWVAVSIPLTGGVLPSTLAAKVAQARSGYWSGFLPGMFFFPLKKGMTLWFLLGLPLGAVGAAASIRWRLGILVPLVLGALGQVVAYGIVFDVAYYAWYVALPVLLLAWLAGCGAEWLLLLSWRRWVRAVVAVVLLGLLVAAVAQTPVMRPVRLEQAVVASWLASNTPADATVAASEIGRIGALSHRSMIDYLGLLDSSTIPHLERSDWTWWLDEMKPDYWVADRTAGFTPDEQALQSSAARSQYVPVMETEHLVVLQRVG